MEIKEISKSTLQRLPTYLSYLRELPHDDSFPKNISSAAIAAALGCGEIQVRKDLASVSKSGKPKIGYLINDLISDLEEFLGYNDLSDAVIVGCGKLGNALLDYGGFEEYGLQIIAGFDNDETKLGKSETGKEILSINKFADLCQRMKIQLGVITVPSYKAQEVCDLMVDSGIRAILNFAPIHLKVPNKILVKNENIAVSLAELSNKLVLKTNGNEQED